MYSWMAISVTDPRSVVGRSLIKNALGQVAGESVDDTMIPNEAIRFAPTATPVPTPVPSPAVSLRDEPEVSTNSAVITDQPQVQ
jgi:hypothetical protein